jgi:hypothetical protein
MAIERKRGCGYRKVGALYLVGMGYALPCEKMPYPIYRCPVCDQGIKQSRGWTWIKTPDEYFFVGDCSRLSENFDLIYYNCANGGICPFKTDKLAILWVGSRYYTPDSFRKEAMEMGVSKRINAIPRGFKVGEDYILLAHPKAIVREERVFENEDDELGVLKKVEEPGIFFAFKPMRIEMLVYESELTKEKQEELEKRGITPIPVPDGDMDHSTSTGRTGNDKPKETLEDFTGDVPF